jgi:hypothetical protein
MTPAARSTRWSPAFDEAYRRTDWSRFAQLPALEVANRRNAYRAYLQMQDGCFEQAQR